MAAAEPKLIALDWGTSSLRAYLMGPGGTVTDTRAAPRGIMRVEGGNFAAALDEVAGEWQRRWPGLPAVAAGMIGSAQGWVEVPYRECPAGAEELAAALVPVPGAALRIIPGVAQYGAAPNMMRGEETQIAGALAQRPELRGRTRFVLPGTHSKWAEVTEGRIRRFTTFMTGELFGVLRQHSILGRFAKPDAPPPAEDAARDAFARGVAALRDGSGNAAPLLFSARALVLADQLPPELSVEYLSGLLIGEELRCGLAEGRDGLALVGDAALCERYARALAIFGVPEVAVLNDTAPAGLWQVAELAGLCGGTEMAR
ncbi:2-dehydro-3-deoxygalactonokinase [Roseomonas sp. BN140053]|uniref:2-dehydro-3-deoxygalactonokinase n=1 Tax=Roseomonas sp. BN140053 TaxID=3391898 RepID=UPI0039E7BB92